LIWLGAIAFATKAVGVVVCAGFAETVDVESLVPSEFTEYIR